jgi:hypothetical protein
MFIQSTGRNFHVFVVVILLLSAPKSVLAQYHSTDDLVTISSVIPFANHELGSEAIRSECTWD